MVEKQNWEKIEPNSAGAASSIYAIAVSLRVINQDARGLILAIRNNIQEHAKSLPTSYYPQSIPESRFTPPQVAYDRGMISCGTVSNVTTCRIRSAINPRRNPAASGSCLGY